MDSILFIFRCRKSCKNESDSSELMGDHLDASEIFFERMIRNALCLIKCRRDKFTARKDHVVEIKIVKEFELRKPYDYLQLCLFKVSSYVVEIKIVKEFELRKPCDYLQLCLLKVSYHVVKSRLLRSSN